MAEPEYMKTGVFSVVRKYWYLCALALIALLSFGLNFLAIAKVGYGNAYYAAAIRSMTESFRNFFYVSFDPAGFVSVDKPPLGLWVQALFVFILGYHGWAMLLPQALAATGAAIMMYILMSKYFGRAAGLIAALVVAVTPAVVVAARNNTMDTQLIFVLLVAAWFLFRSIETSQRRYLFMCAVFVGLGFNIKMLEAYMILPAIVLVYLVFDRNKLARRFAAGTVGLVLMLVISSAWVLAVDLTPADRRPYVGSSSDNTEAQLIIGHNGLERLYGSGGGTGIIFGKSPIIHTGGNFSQNSGSAALTSRALTPVAAASPDLYNFGARNSGSVVHPGAGIGGGQSGALPPGNSVAGKPAPWTNTMGLPKIPGLAGGFGNDIGTAGPLRLWNIGLFGQVTWLFVLAFFCILVKVKRFSFKSVTTRQAVFVFWIAWLLTVTVFFSEASFWHRYYLCVAAPAVAGLVGIGLPALIRTFRDRAGWKQFLLPLALLGTFIPAIFYIWNYAELRSWLAPLMIAAAAAALLLMAAHYIKLPKLLPERLIVHAASALMLVSLLAGPFYWSLTAVLYVEQNSTLPYAGPELAITSMARFTTPNQEVLTTGDSGTVALEKYLVSHYKPGSCLVVAKRADDVAEFIVDTGLPAVAYGGFLGSDKAMTLDTLKELVAEGKITYFLLNWQGGGSNDAIDAYVRQNAKLVAPSEYLGVTSHKAGGPAAINGVGTSNGIGSDALYLF